MKRSTHADSLCRRPSSFYPPIRQNLLLVLALSLAFPATAQSDDALTFPAQVGVDIVFPRDDTYPPSEPFPIVFAFSGASAAWTYGFDFSWSLRRTDGCEGACGVVDSGQFSIEEGLVSSVSFGDDDAYYLTTSAIGLGPSVAYEGGYSLEWAFGFARNCSSSGGVQSSTGGVTSASGAASFAVSSSSGASTADVAAQLEEECPLVGGAVTVVADLDGCPELGTGDAAAADLCDLDVPQDVVNFVANNLGSSKTEGTSLVESLTVSGLSSTAVSTPSSASSASATSATSEAARPSGNPPSGGTNATGSLTTATATAGNNGTSITATPTMPVSNDAPVLAVVSHAQWVLALSFWMVAFLIT